MKHMRWKGTRNGNSNNIYKGKKSSFHKGFLEKILYGIRDGNDKIEEGEGGIFELSVVNNRIRCRFEERRKKITKADCGG